MMRSSSASGCSSGSFSSQRASGSSSCSSALSAVSRPRDIPLLLDAVVGHVQAEQVGDHPGAQVGDARRDVLRLEQLVAQRVDRLALVVGDVVVLEQLLADVEVARLDLALRAFDRARHHRVLDRLALGHLQHHHDAVDALAGEDAQQRVLERHVEARAARVALAAGAAAQLVVDAARLVALGADDVQAARLHHLVVQRLPLAAQLLDARSLFVGGRASRPPRRNRTASRRCRRARCRCRGRPCWWRW